MTREQELALLLREQARDNRMDVGRATGFSTMMNVEGLDAPLYIFKPTYRPQPGEKGFARRDRNGRFLKKSLFDRVSSPISTGMVPASHASRMGYATG